MLKRLFGLMLLVLVLGSAGLAYADDLPGSNDPPLFNRMPDYSIYVYEQNDFNHYEFPTAVEKTTPVEGRYYHVEYQMPWGAKYASPVAIIRNYENAIKAIGGKVVYVPVPNWETVLKVSKSGSETWIHVKINSADGSAYTVYVVEKADMVQNVVANTVSIAQSIKDTGKATLYGIFFDTGKADVKAESEPALKEIAKLLQDNQKLKLYVVGHTDNVGTLDANMKLSKDRADAVIKVLVSKYSVKADRLIANGVGPLAPVASNATEDGRTLNRRVELVVQ